MLCKTLTHDHAQHIMLGIKFIMFINVICMYIVHLKFHEDGPRGRVVKVADFSALDHSIISPMWVRASHGARIHM